MAKTWRVFFFFFIYQRTRNNVLTRRGKYVILSVWIWLSGSWSVLFTKIDINLDTSNPKIWDSIVRFSLSLLNCVCKLTLRLRQRKELMLYNTGQSCGQSTFPGTLFFFAPANARSPIWSISVGRRFDMTRDIMCNIATRSFVCQLWGSLTSEVRHAWMDVSELTAVLWKEMQL